MFCHGPSWVFDCRARSCLVPSSRASSRRVSWFLFLVNGRSASTRLMLSDFSPRRTSRLSRVRMVPLAKFGAESATLEGYRLVAGAMVAGPGHFSPLALLVACQLSRQVASRSPRRLPTHRMGGVDGVMRGGPTRNYQTGFRAVERRHGTTCLESRPDDQRRGHSCRRGRGHGIDSGRTLERPAAQRSGSRTRRTARRRGR